MKRTLRFRGMLFVMILSLSLLVFFTGCAGKSKAPNREEVDFGLIVTTQQHYISQILWFDQDLQLQSTQQLPYADLGNSWSRTVEANGKFYVTPKGLGNRKDTKKSSASTKRVWRSRNMAFRTSA